MGLTVGKLLIGATLLALFIGISNQVFEEEMNHEPNQITRHSSGTNAIPGQ